MKTVFLLIQDQYHEGNFGDLEQGPPLIHGIYSTLKKAKEVKNTINQEMIVAQDGSAKEITEIIPVIIDKQIKTLL